MRSFFRICRSPIHSRTVVLLLALTYSSLALADEIHDAAESGDLEKVKVLLKANPDLVFSNDKEGQTPLHSAVWYGRQDMAELLLAACRALVAGLFCDDDGLHLKSERAQAYREHACTIRQR